MEWPTMSLLVVAVSFSAIFGAIARVFRVGPLRVRRLARRVILHLHVLGTLLPEIHLLLLLLIFVRQTVRMHRVLENRWSWKIMLRQLVNWTLGHLRLILHDLFRRYVNLVRDLLAMNLIRRSFLRIDLLLDVDSFRALTGIVAEHLRCQLAVDRFWSTKKSELQVYDLKNLISLLQFERTLLLVALQSF